MLNMSMMTARRGMGVPNVDAMAQAIAVGIREGMSGQRDAGQLVGFRHDATGDPATTGFVHGPNGLLRYPGVDPAMFHTILGHEGIMSQLQWTGTRYMNPLYEILTGLTAADDSVREADCDPAPTSGMLKGCINTAAFGWIARGTREVSATRLGQLLDRAEPLDLFVVGSPIFDPILPGQPAPGVTDTAAILGEVARLLSDRAVAMNDDLAKMAYAGNPSNNTGGYAEFPGLQLLVNGPIGGPGTGTAVYKDAITGTACPSVDSNVQDFAYKSISGLGAATNGALLVRWLAYIVRYAVELARRTKVAPVRWAFAMRPALFYELSAIWPCSYYLGGCTVVDATGGQSIVLDAKDTTDLRDQMRTGKFLLIDGMRWDVILDDAIPEHTNTDNANVASGSMSSDIYLLPFSVLGGRSTLYGEYFDWTGAGQINQLFGRQFLGTIEGAFFMTPRQTNSCWVEDMEVKPRIILRTPWLAARMLNVQYTPLLHDREPFNDDPYFLDGGVQGARTAPTYQNQWS